MKQLPRMTIGRTPQPLYGPLAISRLAGTTRVATRYLEGGRIEHGPLSILIQHRFAGPPCRVPILPLLSLPLRPPPFAPVPHHLDLSAQQASLRPGSSIA
eukprot:2174565-Rhodomonas_salina.4